MNATDCKLYEAYSYAPVIKLLIPLECVVEKFKYDIIYVTERSEIAPSSARILTYIIVITLVCLLFLFLEPPFMLLFGLHAANAFTATSAAQQSEHLVRVPHGLAQITTAVKNLCRDPTRRVRYTDYVDKVQSISRSYHLFFEYALKCFCLYRAS